MVRAGFGFFQGPVDGVFRGVAAMENRQLEVIEGLSEADHGVRLRSLVRVWRRLRSDPELEVGALFGLVSGQYQTRVESIVFDPDNGRVQDSGETQSSSTPIRTTTSASTVSRCSGRRRSFDRLWVPVSCDG